jgi:hypothetical protein
MSNLVVVLLMLGTFVALALALRATERHMQHALPPAVDESLPRDGS